MTDTADYRLRVARTAEQLVQMTGAETAVQRMSCGCYSLAAHIDQLPHHDVLGWLIPDSARVLVWSSSADPSVDVVAVLAAPACPAHVHVEQIERPAVGLRGAGQVESTAGAPVEDHPLGGSVRTLMDAVTARKWATARLALGKIEKQVERLSRQSR